MPVTEPLNAERAGSAAPPARGRHSGRWAIPIVDAKLRPPQPKTGTIPRARLLRLLVEGPGTSVVSMVAPAGYGKTMLLAEWALAEHRPVAWLTIDDVDNDPTVLLTHLAAAFDAIEPLDEALPARLGGGKRVIAAAVPRLASELHRWPTPGVIVIDDVHRLTDRVGLDALAGLIDHLPPNFRVAVAGRHEPGLPFARLRARRDLLELGPADLALDSDETRDLVTAVGCRLSAHEIEAVRARTEGWPAGIYLMTLAIGRGRRNGASSDGGSSVNGHVADYLRSEFAEQLDEEDLALLTRSAVLEQVSVPAAEAIAEVGDTANRLLRLSQSNLLIQRIDSDEPTFRYHNLLREFLVGELERREPGSLALVNSRAANWYASRGAWEWAIDHALAAGDEAAAAHYVVSASLTTHYRGQTATVERWLDRFEARSFVGYPPLAVIAAWVYLLVGRPEYADRMADIADRAVFHGPPGDGSASFASQRAMLRTIMFRNGPREGLANAKTAAALERPGSAWRPLALALLGSASELVGELDKAEASYIESVKAGSSSAPATVMWALAKRAALRLRVGDWATATELIRESEAILEEWHYVAILSSLLVHAVGARVAIQAGDIEGGRARLVRAQLVRPLASHSAPFISVEALLHLSRAYLQLSDPAGAQQALREAEQIVRRRPALGQLTSELVELRRQLEGASATLAGSSTLTPAELRVLPLLPTYLSFQEIAERLMISRNTVKSHAMSIYSKLWASSRGEAVERAVEIGLLEPYPALANGRSIATAGGSREPSEDPAEPVVAADRHSPAVSPRT